MDRDRQMGEWLLNAQMHGYTDWHTVCPEANITVTSEWKTNQVKSSDVLKTDIYYLKKKMSDLIRK